MESVSVVPEAKNPNPERAKSPQVPASEVSAAMHREDRFAHHMGMTIEEVSLGSARLSMVIRDETANGHDIGHGGTIFSLADTAMAHACNSYNRVAVAVSCNIEFIAAARLGDVLTATATEQSRAGRNAVYDVRACDQDGKLIALFRGKTRVIGDALVGGADSSK